MDELNIQTQTALITAAASIAAVALTFAFKMFGEMVNRSRTHKMNLLTLRNELITNSRIADSIAKNTRTLGYRFMTKSWLTIDISAIHRKKIPYTQITETYSLIELFNLMAERHKIIEDDANYQNKKDRLALEHVEMVELSEMIQNNLKNVLSSKHFQISQRKSGA